MKEVLTSDLQDLLLKSIRGDQEVEFSTDPDGDLYIQITGRRDVPQSIYLKGTAARRLRDWLNKVMSDDK